ncbi:flagellar hook-basal body complex protein [Bacillus sp. FJAT-27251]|uniref:flagellar hook-basal body complex protein n=1 Tax=Bacillus sp. FJAT-27251 TaxID=1684142 RepID=UPI0006A77F3E|nr:flagellar hook-basal body complex protein [Bacillus sp. FJAT-27251]
MLRSMYSGVSGMKGFQTKLDVIGNNIANVNTVGYKKSRINFQDLLSQNVSNSSVNPMQVGLGNSTSSIDVLHTPGSLMTTGVNTDVSIMGDGFFVVQNQQDNGQPISYLTRSGNFVVDKEGQLLTTQGYQVMGRSGANNAVVGPITIDPAVYDSFAINRAGEIYGKRSADGQEILISTLGIVTPENPAGLSKVGGSLYAMTISADENGVIDNADIQTARGANTEVISGQLEMSNVDLTEEFTEMIVAQRGFQANSRIITTSDEILQEVVNLKR